MSENSPDLEDDTGTYESGLPGFLGTIDEVIAKTEAVMLAVGVILMAVNTCINVIARFVFGEGLFFSGEINRILIILITFAGIGYAARHGRHIRMSAVYDAIPPKGRKVLMIFIALFTSLVMFFLCYHSYGYVETLTAVGEFSLRWALRSGGFTFGRQWALRLPAFSISSQRSRISPARMFISPLV